jgi:hypothetical protein
VEDDLEEVKDFVQELQPNPKKKRLIRLIIFGKQVLIVI